MCINDLDDQGNKLNKKIYGYTGVDLRTIEINFIPCVPKQLTLYNKHLVDKECIADLKDPKAVAAKLQETKDYLGQPKISFFSNNQRLDLKEFGDKTVVN